MSRVGKKLLEIPSDVTVTLNDNNTVAVKGPKGELTRTFHPDMEIKVEDNVLTVARPLIKKSTVPCMVRLAVCLATWLKVYLKDLKEVWN